MSGLPGMPWPLPYPFDTTVMQLALIGGLALASSAPLLGAFLVQQRLSLIGDGLGHVAFAGVGVALFFGTAPLWTALGAALVAAVGIEMLRERSSASGDLVLALVFYGGLAFGTVLASRGAPDADLEEFLFGSILELNRTTTWGIVGLAAVIVVTMLVAHRALLATVLDESAARVEGIPVTLINLTLAVLTACTIVLGMRVVGVLLVGALIVLPIATSRLVARSFTSTLVCASIVGALSVVLGLIAARAWELAPGATIVLTATALFGGAALLTGARRAAADGALLSGH
jgi:zinc transport system permease protein